MKMIFLPTSSNKKTGDIMQSYSSRSTCPKSCVFKNNGCYAEGCHTKMVWDRCEDKNDARYVINGEHLKIGPSRVSLTSSVRTRLVTLSCSVTMWQEILQSRAQA